MWRRASARHGKIDDITIATKVPCHWTGTLIIRLAGNTLIFQFILVGMG